MSVGEQSRARTYRRPSSLRYYQDGPPQREDWSDWSLDITGLGVEGIVLNADDLQTLPRLAESRRYVCVCKWSVRENWGGVLVEDLLHLAGWDGRTDGRYLKQVSVGTPEKGRYDSTIPLDGLLARRAMVIDRLDDQPLPLERGYPARLMDFGLYAYKSVKCLRRLIVTDSYELGEWERRAGYELSGEIQPKRYSFCDLGEHRFLAGPGEVTEF